MEKKKKKDHKSGSTTHQEAEEPHHLSVSNKEDQNQSGAKKNTSGSSSHENAQPSNQQFQPNFQWPYSAQSDVEQTPLISKPCIPSHSPSSIILGHCQNSQLNQVQHNQPAPHSAQAAMSFWLAQQPGYHLPGANGPAAYHPFTPVGTTDVTWQGTNTINGDFSPGNQLQPPCYSYPVGYPYPGFPGPWNPSSWWVQQQQSIPPFTYTNLGACGYLSSSVRRCLAASGPSSQRGIIQPPAKLSQKHQQIWEAQSAENVQLWNVVGHLQSELANYKNRLTKLEADVLSPKPTVTEPAVHGSGANLPGEKKTKRGRPKRQIASNDVSPSTGRSLPRARGRKPKLHNAQSETKELNCEKYSQKKLKVKAAIQKEIDGKTANVVTDSGDRNGINISNPIFHNQTWQEDTNRVKSSSESKFDNIKVGVSKTNFSITSHQIKGMETKNDCATYGGMTNDGKFMWPSNVSTSNCGKDLININSQSFYNDFNFTGHARRLVGGWSFGNEDVSVSQENVAIESGSNENEQIENDGSSSAEDTA